VVAIFAHEDRAAFKTCRRAWDLGARTRRNLEPSAVSPPFDTDRVVRDALAVYYFPGMWDWSPAVVVPLVFQALDQAVARESARLGPDRMDNFSAVTEGARRLLQAYIDWAPPVERVAPVLIEVDFQADVPDPDRPDLGLFTPDGTNVRYEGRIDLLGVDEFDAYWIVRHRLVREWTPTDLLLRDEESLAACWAWEQFYIGMEIAGTVHNELRLPSRDGLGAPGPDPSGPPNTGRGWVAEHEASGGGRSVPQHRRLYARSKQPDALERVRHDTGPWFRRTWIRRTRDEVTAAGRQLASDSRQLFAPDVAVYPSPSPAACRRCPFESPCQALYEGRAREAEAILATSYQARPPAPLVEGRLGGVTWSTGRGAAPPRFADPAS
jgi:hypothetical protein